MKKIYFSNLVMLLALVISTLSYAQYDEGVLVANEGNFGTPNASVTYLKIPGFEKTDNVYQTVNNEPLGDVLQSIAFHGNNAFLVVNNSNKIVKVDKASFVKDTEITEEINQPRYMTFANDKFYVTNRKYVSIYNVEDNSFLKKITFDSSVEKIQTIDNHVVVMKASFGSGQEVALINSEDDELVKILDVGEVVLDIKVYKGKLYVLTKESIIKYDKDLNVLKSLDISSFGRIKKMDVDEDMVYFVADRTKVYKIKTSLNEEPTFYLEVDKNGEPFYGMNVIDGILFNCNALNYSDNADITLYVNYPIYSFKAGFISNGVYKNMKSNMSIDELLQNETLEVTVYPNPTNGVFKINGVETANVTIYNLAGQVVKSLEYNGNEIYVSDVAKGVYVVVIESDNKVTKTKLIIK